jgi:glycosyltransferase involved in cell wall biosynthesis
MNAWFWNSPTTGSGQYTRRLAGQLCVLDPGTEVLLVSAKGWGFQVSSSKFQVSGSGELETWNLKPETSHLRKVWFEQVSFPRACARLKADVAHVPYWAPPLAPPLPTVVTIHDLIPLLLPQYRGGPPVRLYTALVSRTARRAAVVLTDSAAARRDVLARLKLSPQRVRVAHLAADQRYRPSPTPADQSIRARYGVSGRYVLYLGGFDVRKNVATALAAYHSATPAIAAHCRLVIAGQLPERDTPFTPDPRRIAREQGIKETHIRFTGFVDEAHKPALYRGATAFIFPSRYEGFGLPPLEALACGTPVVGSDRASLPEVVGSAGVLLPPDDAAGMGDALVRLATYEDFRAELAHRALAQAAGFSWKRTAQGTRSAYCAALESRTAPTL